MIKEKTAKEAIDFWYQMLGKGHMPELASFVGYYVVFWKGSSGNCSKKFEDNETVDNEPQMPPVKPQKTYDDPEPWWLEFERDKYIECVTRTETIDNITMTTSVSFRDVQEYCVATPCGSMPVEK